MHRDFTLLFSFPKVPIPSERIFEFVYDKVENEKELKIDCLSRNIDTGADYIYQHAEEEIKKTTYVTLYFRAESYPPKSMHDRQIIRHILKVLYSCTELQTLVFNDKDVEFFTKCKKTIDW